MNHPATDSENEQVWREFLTHGFPDGNRSRRLFRYLPKSPRCKNCYAPFQGIGGVVVRLVFNKRPSPHNPMVCNFCEEFASHYPGGAEVQLAMLFADVRGSTTLAEKMGPRDFSRLINRFYNTSMDVLVHSSAVIDRLVGDEMIGYFLPVFSGPDYHRKAVKAAQELLRATGHADPAGPWIPVGIGVHTGLAFFGAVGKKEGVIDITALGDPVNATARLASQAGAGEILISEEAYQAAGLDIGDLEKRQLTLKGRNEPMPVRVLNELEAIRQL